MDSLVNNRLSYVALFGLSLLVAVIGTLMSLPQHASALVVSPYLSEARIVPEDTNKIISFKLTNDSMTQQTYNLSAVDFGSLGAGSGLLYAGYDTTKLTPKYGLAPWLHLPADKITIDAGQTMQLDATIANEASLGPGGHYAAILMSLDNRSGQANGDTVTIQQKVSALIFATKVGGEVYDMKLTGLQHDGDWRALPGVITLTFQNNGNVHIVPRGTVKLLTSSGQVVSQGIINEASSYVLPETSRQLAIQMSSVGHHGWRPGNYTLQVDYRYDGHEAFAHKSIVIRYNNLRGIGLLVAGLLTMLVVFMRYKRHRREPIVEGSSESE